jgi:hypothetical protein
VRFDRAAEALWLAAERPVRWADERSLLNLVLTALIALGCGHSPLIVERVVERDPDLRIVRTLEDRASLDRFSSLWSTRERSGKFVEDYTTFAFTIDITANQSSGRWLYRADGTTAILSIKSTEMLVVQDPAAMNALLGIEEPAAP